MAKRRGQENTVTAGGEDGPPSRWIVVLLLSSLLIPAATKQWSDRNAENALKADLVDRISVLTQGTFARGAIYMDDLTPETHVRIYCESGRIPESECSLEPLVRTEVLAEQQAVLDSFLKFADESASVRGTVQSRFQDSSLSSETLRFTSALEVYLNSVHLGCPGAFFDVETMLLVTELTAEDVPQLTDKTEQECSQGFETNSARHRAFIEERIGVQGELWSAAHRLIDRVVVADVVGLSSGLEDFLKDVWWILLIAGLVAFSPQLWDWARGRR